VPPLQQSTTFVRDEDYQPRFWYGGDFQPI